MIELVRNLFVGSSQEWEDLNLKDVMVVHACKTYHKKFLWYSGNLDPEHPSYLIAKSGKEIFLNLVDAKESKYFNPELIDDVVESMLCMLSLPDLDAPEDGIERRKIYLHCDQGQSRAPGIAMIILLALGYLHSDFDVAMFKFKELYPKFEPGKGMYDYLKENWARYADYFKLPGDPSKLNDPTGEFLNPSDILTPKDVR